MSGLELAIEMTTPSSACEEYKLGLSQSFSMTLEAILATQKHSEAKLIEDVVERFTSMLRDMHFTASICNAADRQVNLGQSEHKYFGDIAEPNARHCENASPIAPLAAAAGGVYNCTWDTSSPCFYDGGDKYCWYKCTPTGESSGGGGNVYNVSGGTVSSPSGGIPYGADWVETYPGGNIVISPGQANPFEVDTSSWLDRYWNYGSAIGGSRLIDNLELYNPGGFCPGDV